ncbi:MAG: chemotaxis protein CheC [Gammaproteobacteria bacterium]|nr:chemotaxis protein CheC [Gammaproteobacteria bacterium]
MNDKTKNSFTSFDLLQKIGMLGSKKAAAALAEFLNCEVEIPLSEANIIPLKSLNTIFGNLENLYFVMDGEVTGEIEGRTCFFLSPQEAQNLGAILLKKNTEISRDDPLFQSALNEVMNIISGAYINVLADKIHAKIMRGPPSLAIDMVGAILDFLYAYFNSHTSNVFLIKTKLKVKNSPYEGLFIFLPKKESIEKVFGSYSAYFQNQSN